MAGLGGIGQTLSRSSVTQVSQNVHSKVQIRASSELGGRALLQCSQVGRSSSTVDLLVARSELYVGAVATCTGGAWAARRRIGLKSLAAHVPCRRKNRKTNDHDRYLRVALGAASARGSGVCSSERLGLIGTAARVRALFGLRVTGSARREVLVALRPRRSTLGGVSELAEFLRAAAGLGDLRGPLNGSVARRKL